MNWCRSFVLNRSKHLISCFSHLAIIVKLLEPFVHCGIFVRPRKEHAHWIVVKLCPKISPWTFILPILCKIEIMSVPKRLGVLLKPAKCSIHSFMHIFIHSFVLGVQSCILHYLARIAIHCTHVCSSRDYDERANGVSLRFTRQIEYACISKGWLL